MKVQIKCPRCDSEKVDIVAEKGNPLPMYKCKSCGYKNNLFPQFRNEQSENSEEYNDED